jgi:hypothetical protein
MDEARHASDPIEPEELLAILCVRGVGLDLENASAQLLTSTNVALKDAQEANWSWQDFVPKHIDEWQFVSLPSLRRLSTALRTAAMSGFDTPVDGRCRLVESTQIILCGYFSNYLH